MDHCGYVLLPLENMHFVVTPPCPLKNIRQLAVRFAHTPTHRCADAVTEHQGVQQSSPGTTHHDVYQTHFARTANHIEIPNKPQHGQRWPSTPLQQTSATPPPSAQQQDVIQHIHSFWDHYFMPHEIPAHLRGTKGQGSEADLLLQSGKHMAHLHPISGSGRGVTCQVACR